MKANAIKTLAAFAVVLLFVSGTLFAQQQGPGKTPEAFADPHVGMTIPADFVMPTDPTIGVLAEDGSTYGIYKKVPARIRSNEQMPATGPMEEPNTAPNYWNVNISYYTDQNGNEFSVKYVVDGGIADKMPVVSGAHSEQLEQDMAAWETAFEAIHE